MEWRLGFGHEGAYASVQFRFHADHFASLRQNLLAQVGDRLHIFQGFAGVTDHEVQLDRRPAAAVDLARGVDDLFIRDKFIDDTAHPFGGGFGREGKAAGASVFAQDLHKVDADRFDAQGWQANVQAFAFVNDLPGFS